MRMLLTYVLSHLSYIWHRYYHFGVARALLDANLLPRVITGTSGGALVAALLCTRTNVELKELLVPELATKITACHDNALVSTLPSLLVDHLLRVIDLDTAMVEDWSKVR